MEPVAGIGLRSPHLAEIARDRPATGFLEIHAENYLVNSPALRTVELLRGDYEFSVHAVGLSLGSADGLDEAHLDRVAALIRRLEPTLVSDHLSWSLADGRYFNDLLPLPYTEEALGVVEAAPQNRRQLGLNTDAAHGEQAQDSQVAILAPAGLSERGERRLGIGADPA